MGGRFASEVCTELMGNSLCANDMVTTVGYCGIYCVRYVVLSNNNFVGCAHFRPYGVCFGRDAHIHQNALSICHK